MQIVKSQIDSFSARTFEIYFDVELSMTNLFVLFLLTFLRAEKTVKSQKYYIYRGKVLL